MSIYAIGDIHGCNKELKQLLTMIQYAPDDIFVFLGDYIDRGPESAQVIDTLIEFRDTIDNECYFLRGNHEDMYRDSSMVKVWKANGGLATIESYKNYTRCSTYRHKEFYSNLISHVVIDEYCFVHAGLAPNISIDDNTTDDMLWIRGEFILSDYDWGKRIVFGHTPTYYPIIQPNKIGIDTGCYKTGRLTAVKLPELEFITTENTKYSKIRGII